VEVGRGSSWRLGNTVREVVRQYLDGSEVRLSKPNEKCRVGVVNLSHVVKVRGAPGKRTSSRSEDEEARARAYRQLPVDT
jgi:hypothetical protein